MPAAESCFHLTPTLVAHYFFRDCERYLRYCATRRAERRRSKIPEAAFDHSPLMRDVLASGSAWEVQVVVTHCLAGRVAIAPGDGPLPERRFSASETLDLLRSARAGTYLSETNLEPPVRFLAQFGLDPAFVRFGANHPDLIEVRQQDGQRLFRIIEIKRSEELRLTRRIQILIYALEMDALLADAGIGKAQANLVSGGVWLEGRSEPESFDLTDVRPHFDRFLRHDLGRIFAALADAAFWHFRYRCEQCDYYAHCRDEMNSSRNVSQLANLTVPGKRYLESLDVCSLPDLKRFLRKDADPLLSG